MEKSSTILLILGFIGGYSQHVVDLEPLFKSLFYLFSTIAVVVGVSIKIYDRIKK
jgi:hypothetical protein